MSDEQNQKTVVVETPGPLLKAARESAGLTTQQVADRLNLRHSVVLGLEQDKTDHSMSVTYIRGYARNYARLVGLDETRLNAALDTLHQAADVSMQSFSRRTKQERTDNRWMMVTWIMVLAIIGMVVWWWMSTESTRTITPEPQIEAPQVSESVDSAPSFSESHFTPSVEQQVVTSDLNVTGDVFDGTEAPISTDESTTALTEGVAAESSAPNSEPDNAPTTPSEATTEVAESQSPPVTEDEPAVTEVSEASTPELAPLAPGMGRLVISLEADCWMRVTDANGREIFEGLKKNGFETTLEGKAPLKVRLGAPKGVNLTYNGEPVDLSSYRAGRPANVILPQ